MSNTIKRETTYLNNKIILNSEVDGSVENTATSYNNNLNQNITDRNTDLTDSFLEIKSNIKDFNKFPEFLKSYNKEHLCRKKHYYLLQTVTNNNLNKITSDICMVTDQSKKLSDLRITLLIQKLKFSS